MLLAIEQGNTNTLFAVHDGARLDRPVARGHRRHAHRRRIRRLAAQLLGMAGLTLGDLDACIISSVVPQSIFNLRNLSRRYLHVEPLVIGENADLGIEVRIEKPSEAGADRLVNAIGAHIDLSRRPADGGLRHRHHLRRGRRRRRVRGRGDRAGDQPLHAGAARGRRPPAARRHPASPAHVIGNDTVGAMQSGVFWGYVALIEGLIDRIKAEYRRAA